MTTKLPPRQLTQIERQQAALMHLSVIRREMAKALRALHAGETVEGTELDALIAAEDAALAALKEAVEQ